MKELILINNLKAFLTATSSSLVTFSALKIEYRSDLIISIVKFSEKSWHLGFRLEISFESECRELRHLLDSLPCDHRKFEFKDGFFAYVMNVSDSIEVIANMIQNALRNFSKAHPETSVKITQMKSNVVFKFLN